MMRLASLSLCGALASLLTPQLGAQQLVTNGTFSSSTSGWTQGGTGCNKGVRTKQVVNAVNSAAYCVRPGGTVFNPPHPPATLCQNVALVEGVCYQLDLYAALFVGTTNAQGGQLSVKIGTRTVATYTGWDRSVNPGTYRTHLSADFQWTGTTGNYALCLLMGRSKYTCNSNTPEMCIDNVSLVPAPPNILTNGDFSSSSLSPWTGSGPGGSPGVRTIDATGCGPDRAFCVRPGGNTFNPPHPPYVLRQSVPMVNGVLYQFDADVALFTASGNSQGGTVGLRIGGTLLSTFTRWNGSVLANRTERDHMTVLFRWAGTTATHAVDVELRRDKYVHSSVTPTLCVDNLRLRCVPPDIGMTSLSGERRVNTALKFGVRGTANGAFAVFISAGELNNPFPIPPFAGRLQLAFPFVFQVAGVLNGSGNGSFPFSAPPFAAGMPIAFQAINVRGNKLTFGNSLRVCFY